MSDVYLETERMVLKKIQTGDAEKFFELNSDPEVMKYISGGEPTPMEECEAIWQRVSALYERYNDKFGTWMAHLKSTDETVGFFILRPDKLKPDTVENPELGYRLYRKHWGKGYATEGSQALVDKAFEFLDCDSVYAVSMTENQASQKIMKKVGMKFIGEYKQDECCAPGGDTAAVEYKITKEEWTDENKN